MIGGAFDDGRRRACPYATADPRWPADAQIGPVYKPDRLITILQQTVERLRTSDAGLQAAQALFEGVIGEGQAQHLREMLNLVGSEAFLQALHGAGK